jgi:hypothetical protein
MSEGAEVQRYLAPSGPVGTHLVLTYHYGAVNFCALLEVGSQKPTTVHKVARHLERAIAGWGIQSLSKMLRASPLTKACPALSTFSQMHFGG